MFLLITKSPQAKIGYTGYQFVFMLYFCQVFRFLFPLLYYRFRIHMTRRILGLDLGPNSIGWALVDLDDSNSDNSSLVDMGVRVFPEGVDNFDSAKEVSRNEDRRMARGMRRQTKRRVRRKRRLQDALISLGMFPEDFSEQQALLIQDPYELRSRALQKKLSLFEIGRIFLHLNQRRGFLSLSKKEKQDKEVQGMLAEINDLAAKIANSDHQTIGQHLYYKSQNLDHKDRTDNDHLRNRHTRRDMYEAEFDAIWNRQAQFYPELFTERLKYGQFGIQKYPCKPRKRPQGLSLLDAFGLHGLIFFQRSVYWPKSMIGRCELEPKELRCPRADRRAQRFRLLTEVNNLRIIDSSIPAERPLNAQERKLLIDKLAKKKEWEFEAIRKEIAKLPDSPSATQISFNLEKGKRPKMQGLQTDYILASKKAIGSEWHNMPDKVRNEIVALLVDPARNDDVLMEQLVIKYDLTEEQAEGALLADLPVGYLAISLKAINKLLPYMEKGMPYVRGSGTDDDGEPTDALHAAGYLRPDELQCRIFDILPDPQRTSLKECPIGDIPNPVVKRTLVELRKVVNAIIREYGKPNEIHVEMGRDVKTSPKPGSPSYKKYKDGIDRMRANEAKRDAAKNHLHENGKSFGAGGRNILKYLLWKEQGEHCIYSGQPISFNQLMSEAVEIDHILPYSKCLDDSQMNKVICFRQTRNSLGNHDKGNRTPYEWLADSRKSDYDQVCLRAKNLPYPKYKKFIQKHVNLEDFIERQLNEMRYIAKATAEYLRVIMQHNHEVIGLKGQLTAALRRMWGLDTLLAEIPGSPAWTEENELRSGQKNRADHRHHAVDALVIALTDRRRLQQLSSRFIDVERKDTDTGDTVFRTKHMGPKLEEPWPQFRTSVLESVKSINVSHRAQRQVSGRLHDETLYGPTEKEGQWVARKPVESLSANEVEKIRDPHIRKIIIKKLQDSGIEYGRRKSINNKQMKEALANLKMPSGVPIKKVRVLKPEQTIKRIRKYLADPTYVKPGKTHHLSLFEWQENGKTKRDAVFTTMLEATKKLKRGEPVIQRIHPDQPDAKFIMSLSNGEMISVNIGNDHFLLILQTSAQTEKKMTFALNTDARKSDTKKKYNMNTNTIFTKYNAKKVTVDPLGRIRWAND